ncbi:Hypothetical protein R9X50_00013100 [Acrodontium crateriforme]|uniref:ferric-chelate reductase (NADPH) n=1 Tax=Acrodontium crateriforme TaxID=150365 RepID=A0AAQ3LWP7_9PEZI|nr:Hypothetical protein R9X50_00013100 [Acrodontium crateriforme]
MPALHELLSKRAGLALDTLHNTASLAKREVLEATAQLERRINIPYNSSSPAGLIEANTVDPFSKSGKYALGWVYFCVLLLVITTGVRWFHFWNDKIRTAIHKDEMEEAVKTYSPSTDHELSALSTDRSTRKFFPLEAPVPEAPLAQPSGPFTRLGNRMIALSRWVLYQPIPAFHVKKGWRPIIFPSIGIIAIVGSALVFVLLYCFVPQPLYWQSIRFGSPPLAVRAGMIAVAMMPWIVALSMKANFISIMTGIGHERLNVLHRWLGYLCLLLSLIHTVPFYVTPVYDHGGLKVFKAYFSGSGIYIYGTGNIAVIYSYRFMLTFLGVAALVPLLVLCLHSLPPIRHKFYELFVMAHVPISIVFLGMLFWHCNNYLTSWSYLFATMSIWLASYVARLFYLNWTNPWRMSWLVGEEAAVTLLPENAIKVTIPTQVRWKPGQYVYLRMPGVSVFENHPFTIASLCSDDFPSEYGEEYRDMVLVFRPFGGFTKRVLESALEHGPWHTYRAFLDGPYGGMPRSMDSFDHIVMFAGGSGITALVSQLLDLIKRMRDGKAVTKTVQVVWAMKRPETMEWFKEELRICREFAPPDTVTCQFYVTAAKRLTGSNKLVSAQTPTRPVSMVLHDKVNDVFQNIASNRYSMGSNRHSAIIQEEANGDPQKEKELRAEVTDRVRPLPEAHIKPIRNASVRNHLAVPTMNYRSNSRSPTREFEEEYTKETPHLPPHPTLHEKRRSRSLALDIGAAQTVAAASIEQYTQSQDPQNFDFGFPSTPTEFQKNLMRFAFMPAAVKSNKTGWSTEWGRPDIPYMLREMSTEWTGKRTCIFVCGPPSLRVDVSNTVAELQKTLLNGKGQEEIFLHAENYAL